MKRCRVQEVLTDPRSLLIFSGYAFPTNHNYPLTFLPLSGQTRPDIPPTTEAQSYLRLALATHLLPPPPDFYRATTEEFALDSFENVLFSLARFKEMTGRWPERMTVIGFEMKRARYVVVVL